MLAFYGCKLLELRSQGLLEGLIETVLCRSHLRLSLATGQLEGTFVYFSGSENYCINAGRAILMDPPSRR